MGQELPFSKAVSYLQVSSGTASSGLNSRLIQAPFQTKLRISGQEPSQISSSQEEASSSKLSSLAKLLLKRSQEAGAGNATRPSGPSGISGAFDELDQIARSVSRAYDLVKEREASDPVRIAAEQELKDLAESINGILGSDSFKKSKEALTKVVRELNSTGISADSESAIRALGGFLGDRFIVAFENRDVEAINSYSRSLDALFQLNPSDPNLNADTIENFGLAVDTLRRLDQGDNYQLKDQGRIVDLVKTLRSIVDKGLSAVDLRSEEETKDGVKDLEKIKGKSKELSDLGQELQAVLSSTELNDFIRLTSQLVGNIKSGSLSFDRAQRIAEGYKDRFGEGLVNLFKSQSVAKIEDFLSKVEQLSQITFDGESVTRSDLVDARLKIKEVLNTLKTNPFKGNRVGDTDALGPRDGLTPKEILDNIRSKVAQDAANSLIEQLLESYGVQEKSEKDNGTLKEHQLDPFRVKSLLIIQDG